MEKLSQTVKDYALCEGACAVGIATVETLAGGPPSTDLTYVLTGAASAVSFAVPLDVDFIPPFLAKKDRRGHEINNLRTNALSSGLSLQLARYLRQKGHPSVPLVANEVYREDGEHKGVEMFPDISLRYLAVRSGVGHFGFSGNVIRKDHGGAIILGGVVTTAQLVPTDPLPPEENYCDNCHLCLASCASGMFSADEKTMITLGGCEFSYAKRRNYFRCEFVCGGFTGLHSSGKWSTWSPGRFAIPENDADFLPALVSGIKAYGRWPKMEGGHHHVLMRDKLYLTCGHCQLICSPDKEERKARYRMLVESGVVVQNPDGTLEAVPPEAAKKRLKAFKPEQRALYENEG